MQTSNPALKPDVFTQQGYYNRSGEQTMTVDGVISKASILLCIILVSVTWVWSLAFQNSGLATVENMKANYAHISMFITGGGIAAFVIFLVMLFAKSWSPILAPCYAVAEGLAIGGISSYFEMMFPGIVFQASFLTFATFAAMLMGYRAGIIRATEKFRSIVVMATGAIFLLYITVFILSFFGIKMAFLHDSSPLSIGISFVVCTVAALNLILDFDSIERGARQRAPKYIEWYSAFALLVTLVWLYLEFLSLLYKLKARD